MRACEIFSESELLCAAALVEKIATAIIAEAEPVGGVKPLTPDQMRKRQQRRDKAAVNVRDVQAGNAVKLRKAQLKVIQA